MKIIATLILMVSLSLSSFSQIEDQNNEMYRSKVESYTKMKQTGSIMAVTGIGLTLGGILFVSTADWNKTQDSYGNMTYNTTDGKGILGIAGIVVGLPLGVTGIVLNSIGKRKVNYYNQKLENLNVGYFQHGQQKGLTLVITF